MSKIIETVKAAVAGGDSVARFEQQAASVAEELSAAEAAVEKARSEIHTAVASGKSSDSAETALEAAEGKIRRLSERRGAVAAALNRARAESAEKSKAAALADAQKTLAEADVVATKAHSAFADSLAEAGRARTAWEDSEAAVSAARGALMRLGVDVPPAARYAHTAEEAARVALGGGHGALEVRIYRPPSGKSFFDIATS